MPDKRPGVPSQSLQAMIFMVLCLNVVVICLGLLAWRTLTIGFDFTPGSTSFRILMVGIAVGIIAWVLWKRAQRLKGQG